MRLTSSYVYIFLLLLPVLFTGGHAFAQREMQDSLSLLLRAHLVRDTQRVVLLNQLSRVYFNRQPAQAFVYAKEALHISDSLHYTKGKIWAKRNMALVENVHGNLEKQMELTVTALALAEPNDLPAMAVLYNDIGNIYVEQEHPEQGLAYFKKSLPIKQYLHQQVEVGKTLNNIGCAYLKLQQLDSALHYLQAAEAIKLSFQDRPSLAFTYENIGIIHMLSGDYPKSLHYHELSAAYYKEANNLLGLTKAYLNLGLINTMLKRYPVADKYLSNAASLNETQQNVRNELIYYRYRAQLDSARHDYLSALNNYKHYASLNESFFNKEKTQLIEQTREKYESEKRQRENEILKKEQRLNLTTISQQRVFVGAVALLFIILLAATILLYRTYRQQHELYSELNSRNEKVSLQNSIISEQNAALESLHQVKDKIFSVISHDLRSPLAILEGLLFLLRDDKIPQQQFRNYTDELWRDMKNTAYMMDNLLHWASSQMKGIRVHADDFDITGLLNQEFSLLQSLARQKEVTLEHRLNRSILVYADPDMIRLVIRNLISNAIKFTPAGGAISVYALLNERHVEIAVQDNGIGIPEANQAKIFSHLYYSTSGTQNEKGCGLGLTLSKDFLLRNEGTIWFKSQPRNGTTFYFTLPLSQEEEATKSGYTLIIKENNTNLIPKASP
ncbi:ATP-binding protein [Chitinophaga sp. MD30]|uniref:ATP-binding protein n=1 Tax=Chitinophaga sp. MD30 TaxID=2033437 RepID=UPI000BB00FE1|nr:ATP-binding protein [Chitinophaga sp. MD30]ASZ12954.1 hypothetical protein CK934_19320 [Chitinophaga sp. MD30]